VLDLAGQSMISSFHRIALFLQLFAADRLDHFLGGDSPRFAVRENEKNAMCTVINQKWGKKI
jgi:hypothetical protein